MAYYRKEDWKRFLKSIDDRKSMHETWEEWHEAYSNAKKELILKGFSVKDVIIDIDELIGLQKEAKELYIFCESKIKKLDDNLKE
jgi:hypothetical protein